MTTPTAPLLSIALTPALQEVLFFERFDMGAVNRASQRKWSVAGKGVNVATALARLGEQVRVTGFVGGDTGRRLVEAVTASGVTPCFTRVKAATRVCTTLIDNASGSVTELVVEAPTPTTRQLQRFTTTSLDLLACARGLAISGTVPPDLVHHRPYLPFARAAASHDIPWVVDSHRSELLPLLPWRPTVVKMNRNELAATFATTCRTAKELTVAARRLIAAGARHALITDGPKPAWLFDEQGRTWQIKPPRVGPVLNPIGSGDCVTAALLAALSADQPIETAVRHGLACGSANALTALPAHFDTTLLPQLFQATEAVLTSTPHQG